jgi:hypothetical protein
MRMRFGRSGWVESCWNGGQRTGSAVGGVELARKRLRRELLALLSEKRPIDLLQADRPHRPPRRRLLQRAQHEGQRLA